MNRRQFIRAAAAGAAVTGIGGVCYGFHEAGWIEVREQSLSLANLPDSFRGTRVAFLTDIHHGPYNEVSYLKAIVRRTNLLEPDLILLGGDYCLRNATYIAPCLQQLALLRAPLGVYGVLGNHDYWHGISETRAGFQHARITLLNNTNVSLRRGNETLHLAGVDDLWEGEPNITLALRGIPPEDRALLLCHNPDYCEKIRRDPRIGLVLSGHTHGGQIVFPGDKAPFVPSAYGSKYRHGVVEAPAATVYVSRGLGTSVVPMRIASRPELTMITLQAKDQPNA